MNFAISETVLSYFSEFVAAQMGLHFPKERWRDLERGISSAAREFEFEEVEACIQWLVSAPLTKSRVEILASHLTTGETYFFRERRSFEILEEHILPELIRSRRETEKNLRIWCAGCSTGEEPYSIAILLNKMVPDLNEWNITILATDINPRSLQRALEGVYGDWSFRDTPFWIKERYFKRTKEDRFEILPHLKKMVVFSYLNLVEGSYPSLLNNTNAIDLIFCRNVLMYFAQERAKRVIQNLYLSLIDGGYLIVGLSEISHVLFPQFVTTNFPGAILYKKDSKGPQTREVLPYKPDYEAKVSFQPPLDFVAQPEMAVTFRQESTEPSTLETKEQEIAEPERIPYMEALTLYEQGSYGGAVEKLLGLVSHYQDDSEAIALLAQAYANQGRLAEALDWCEKAIAADKLNPERHYLLAMILQEQGRIEEAVIMLKRALYIDQNFVVAHFALGNLTQRQGKFKESDKHFENALSLLSGCRQEEVLPGSEGITAGRLMEIIRSMISGRNLYE